MHNFILARFHSLTPNSGVALLTNPLHSAVKEPTNGAPKVTGSSFPKLEAALQKQKLTQKRNDKIYPLHGSENDVGSFTCRGPAKWKRVQGYQRAKQSPEEES